MVKDVLGNEIKAGSVVAYATTAGREVVQKIYVIDEVMTNGICKTIGHGTIGCVSDRCVVLNGIVS